LMRDTESTHDAGADLNSVPTTNISNTR